MNEIAAVISRFANSFDLKDWDALRSILADQVDVDYSDLRGTRETLAREEYVALREAALQDIDTHHMLSNTEISIGHDSAHCIASGVIFRRKDEEHFDSHVIYRFGLTKSVSSWRISSIKQSVLWNEGNSDIHAGARTNTS
jgi:hypothetical protein